MLIPDGLTFRGNVTVDGYSTVYQYDNENRTLSVPLDAIAPGQTKTISFDVLVNSDAYGMMIENTAVASGSNAPDTGGPRMTASPSRTARRTAVRMQVSK